MNFFAMIADLRFQDAVDILFMSVVAYYLYLWFRGTKAFKALVGLVVLGIAFTMAKAWGLFLTTWVFQIFWQVLVILLIILFQSEIRQVLERVNPMKALGFRRGPDPDEWVPSFSSGVLALASHMIGAIIIIERIDRVDEWVSGGYPLNGTPGPELLKSVFQKDSPLHDGAMVIRGGQVVMVSCYLPLSAAEGLPNEWGTRHRAAMGLSERCDAWVVIVSEERGEVSLARNGQVTRVENREMLYRFILEAIAPASPIKRTWSSRIHSFLTHRWHMKLGSFALVCLVWLMLAGQQDYQVSLHIPLEIKNVPAGMEVVKPLRPEVEITFRGLRKDASTLSEKNIQAEVDLSRAHRGNMFYNITRNQIILPNERVQVVKIEPARMEFDIRVVK